MKTTTTTTTRDGISFLSHLPLPCRRLLCYFLFYHSIYFPQGLDSNHDRTFCIQNLSFKPEPRPVNVVYNLNLYETPINTYLPVKQHVMSCHVMCLAAVGRFIVSISNTIYQVYIYTYYGITVATVATVTTLTGISLSLFVESVRVPL